MNGRLSTLVVLLVLGCFLSATNPNVSDFSSFMRNRTPPPHNPGDILQHIACRVTADAVRADTAIATQRENYILFSVFTYKGAFSGMRSECFVGIASQFFRLK